MLDAELSPTEQLLLDALCVEGTRWHDVDALAAAIELPARIARSGLRLLRLRGLALPRAQFGPGARSWSVTTLGARAQAGVDDEAAA